MAARWTRGAGLLIAQLAACAPGHALEVGPPLDLGIEVDGAVSAVQPLPDGRIVIGGAFRQVRGLRSDGIAMLESDGTGVSAFAPRCRGPVSSDAPPACAISRVVSTNDGALIVAGTFAGFGPVNRDRLAKLDAVTGAADPDWNPFAWIAPAPISDVVAFGDRVVLVLGGVNPRIAVVSLAGAGQPVAGAPQIPLPGGLATVAPPNHVYFVQGPQDQQRVHRVRLDTGTVDPGWVSREFRFVEAMAWDPTGTSLLVAGSEPFSGGLLGRLLVRVSAAEGAPEWVGWNPFQFTISRFRRLLVSNGVVFADACGANVFPCTVTP